MGTVKEEEEKKTQIDFIEASSLRRLLNRVNVHNTECPNNPILKEDVVAVLKEEGTFIMLYYR